MIEATCKASRYNTRFKFECREICDKLGFDLGNAFKYVYRCQDKGKFQDDLNKAIIYIDFAVEKFYRNYISSSLLYATFYGKYDTGKYNEFNRLIDEKQSDIMLKLLRCCTKLKCKAIDEHTFNLCLKEIKEDIIKLKELGANEGLI